MPWLSRVGRYTFRFHALASGLEGAVMGVMSLNDIILRKTLGASDSVLTFMVTGQSVALLFPASWTDFTKGRYIRRSYLWFGLLGRFALGALLFATTPFPFAAIVVATTILYNALLPAQNMLYQANYAARERGKAFGATRRLYAVVYIGAALAAGYCLERDPFAYRWYYIAVGALGFLGCFLFYRVRLRRTAGRGGVHVGPSAIEDAETIGIPMAPAGTMSRAADGSVTNLAAGLATSLANPFAGSWRTLRADRAFLRYEAYFFLYGMAFMMLQPVLPVFLVENLKVDYGEAATAKGLIMMGMFVLFSPLAGRLSDRVGPVRLAAGAFALLALFPSALCLSSGIPSLYVSFAIYGTAMAAVDVAWNMGPIHFAGDRDSTIYMGAHTALVAIRALVGGPLGMVIMRSFGTPKATFLVAAFLFLSASVGMVRLGGRRLAPPESRAAA
jgi:MFS family permease